jgi:hypothetical protein
MTILQNPNPANIFLSMFDSCIVTNNEDYCKDMVANAAPTAVKAYLSVYSGCRRIAGPDTCRDLMAPKSSMSPLIFLAIGGIIGYFLAKLRG